nr:unnamed protein product [Callosobruchus chinensis]
MQSRGEQFDSLLTRP